MSAIRRAPMAVLICLALGACSVRMHAHQSVSGGTAVTTTSSHVSGSGRFAGGRVSFSSGQVPPSNAAGGHLKLSGDAAVVLVVGLVIADLVYYLRGAPQAKPLAADARISRTCSCYKKDGDK